MVILQRFFNETVFFLICQRSERFFERNRGGFAPGCATEKGFVPSTSISILDRTQTNLSARHSAFPATKQREMCLPACESAFPDTKQLKMCLPARERAFLATKQRKMCLPACERAFPDTKQREMCLPACAVSPTRRCSYPRPLHPTRPKHSGRAVILGRLGRKAAVTSLPHPATGR